jgi:hypothetical protein
METQQKQLEARLEREGVWAVSVTSKRPRDNGDTISATFTLRGHWSQSLDGLAGRARGLREAAASDGAG